MTAAIDALDVKTIALLAGLLEADVAMLDEIGHLFDPDAAYGSDRALRVLYAQIAGELHSSLPEHVSLLRFRSVAVAGRTELDAYPVSLVTYLHEEVPQLLRVVDDARRLVELTRTPCDDVTLALHAMPLLEKDSGRALNSDFKLAVLRAFDLSERLDRTGLGRHMVALIQAKAERTRKDFGSFIDVGDFDSEAAGRKLSYYWDDWRISDDEAIDVVKMFETARSQAGRDAILGKLLDMGKLGRLAGNLPWKTVQQLHDATTEPRVRAALLPYYREHIENEPGESLAHMYDRWGVSQARKMQESDSLAGTIGHGALSYGAAFLHTAHNALTFGFLDTYSEAYDLNQQGLISDDALLYTGGVALARSGVVMAATILSGGTAGGFASGTARALGMSRAGAAVVGNLTGGAVAGLTGTFTADLVNIAFLDQKGLSSGTHYLLSAGIGAALGGVGAASEAKFPEAAEATAALYAERYPWLRNLVAASERGGLKTGQAIRPAPGRGLDPFPRTWAAMDRAERAAFQHAYSRHARDFGLGNWSQSNAEALRVAYNAKAAAVRNGAIYSIETIAPRGIRGSGVPTQGVRVRMYVSSEGTDLYYYYEAIDDGGFVSAGRLDHRFSPGADDLLPTLPPLPTSQDATKP